MTMTKTQIGIIGGGPSGLLLSLLLAEYGIESVVLERQTEEYVLGRIRAGLLESGSLEVIERAKAADNLHKFGIPHDGVEIAYQRQTCRVDFKKLTGKPMMIYGQTELTKDLYQAYKERGHQVIHKVEDVEIKDLDSKRPSIEYTVDGSRQTISCDYVVGCDGYHGVSRKTIPDDVRQEYELAYPFGWLGVLSDTKPCSDELIYAYHSRGFALCSMRSETRSRYYVQVPMTDKVENWSDQDFWDEIKRRLPAEAAENLETGPSIEKSIAPLRSFVCETMRWQNLFLVGDAAHIVPPTGAKGLNLAISDVHYLSNALRSLYQDKDQTGIDEYSDTALKRVWKSSRFSWSLTKLLHDFYDSEDQIGARLRQAEFNYLCDSSAAQHSFAENYVGLPF